MASLIAVGSGLLDLLAHVPESFLDRVPGRKGGMELVDYPELRGILDSLPSPPERRPGGSAANTAAAAARLGLPCGFITMIGTDPEEVPVERGVVQLAQREPVRNDRIPAGFAIRSRRTVSPRKVQRRTESGVT